MSNCLSLISCDNSCRNIHNIQGVNVTPLLPFIDDLVQINNDIDCTYYVREVKLVGFVIDTPEFLCGNSRNEDNLVDYPFVRYRLNSLVYNGVQYVNTPIFYTINTGDFQCLVCDSIDGTNCIDTITNDYNNSTAHSTKFNNILSNLGLDLETYPFGDNGATVFRLFNDDYFSLELQRIGTLNPGVYNLLYDNSGLSVQFNENDITTNLVVETTYTCVSNILYREPGSGFGILSVTGVTGCSVNTTFPDYLPVSDCDVITIYPMGVSCFVTNTLLEVGATRTATLVVTGGTPPYTFRWDNGNRTNTISNLPEGTYPATVTDYFGDFIVNTSCFLPGITCNTLNIITTLSYDCITSGGLLTGQANLIITTTGGFPPYIYSGLINGVSVPISNNMIVNDGDIVIVDTSDSNGCLSSSARIGINCTNGLPFDPPLNCEQQVLCPVNTNTFSLEVTATTSLPLYKFTFKLSSPSGYNGSVRGSYKIYGVDMPNTFLNLGVGLTSKPIVWNSYSRVSDIGSPSVQLSDYIEIGFTELTPTNPTTNDDPWEIHITPHTQSFGFYTPINGLTWAPLSTQIYIDVSLYDNDYCVHKNVSLSNFLTLPANGGTQTLTIIF
jgi:hypothetical protein